MGEQKKYVTIDGNEAVVHVAYRVSEVCSIYPITPSSPMAESADVWSAKGIRNIWGQVPDVFEMQSEGGAAGTAHGALQTGALTTTFTSSQGLLLMLPNMYKIAGELTAAVFHVAARALAAQALSIFGDHQDVMSARMTGFAMLSSASVQEAHDLALLSHAATLKSRIPFIHFFDGFRTSHEVSKLELLSDERIRAMIDDDLIYAHRERALNPDNPFIRGTAQIPDVYFQGRESVNPFYAATPGIVQATMDEFAALTGRQYRLFEYHGAEDAERIIVIIGSGAETVLETVNTLNADGAKLGLVQVRLYRPFSAEHLLDAIPESARSIAVLDRTKEPGAGGEPLYQDVLTALMEAHAAGSVEQLPRVIGGRYGLSSKEFTPAMVKAVYDELAKERPKNHFTIGIHDDVSHTSLAWDPGFDIEPQNVTRALFYGLGSDGTVGANKNSIKIIGENTPLYGQGYFVYDSRKAGNQTVSHLRFGPEPIRAPYLIQSANFIATHKFNFIFKSDLLKDAAPGATFLINSPHAADMVWDKLPRPVQQTVLEKEIRLYVIDATTVAEQAGMGRRINTVMQTCFFALAGVLPQEEAIGRIKDAIRKTYARKGRAVVEKNFAAVDAALDHLHRVRVPNRISNNRELDPVVPPEAPRFVHNVTAPMLEGKGDELPVSRIPVDGTYPSGTTRWEKRNIAETVPLWEPELCIQCGNCSFVCPHGVIRAKFYHQSLLDEAPEGFPSAQISARGFPETRYSLQVYLEDCTGCGVCVESCPVRAGETSDTRAINMEPRRPQMRSACHNIRFFERLPINDRAEVDFSSVRGVQFLETLFEFSLACSGCGETPYVKLLSQLYGPRLLVANATGCSSIYGGNLPTTPYTTNPEGRGPTWNNSLFEDTAEFGLGLRIAVDTQAQYARELVRKLADRIDTELAEAILNADQGDEAGIFEQRQRVAALKEKIRDIPARETQALLAVADQLAKKSVWLLGGDGWAYDIGYGGLDHVLASGRNVNILVLDTEVYSNTGGQTSKATPMGAVAKFSAGGKPINKKDLAMMAMAYGNVYVAQVAFGAKDVQTLRAFLEAESYDGPSLIIAYSPCIAHGVGLSNNLRQQNLAVNSGHWDLFRYDPRKAEQGENPLHMDSKKPSIPLRDFVSTETRFSVLQRTHPDAAERFLHQAQRQVESKFLLYEQLAQLAVQNASDKPQNE